MEVISDIPVFTDFGDEDNALLLFADALLTLPGDVGETILDLLGGRKRNACSNISNLKLILGKTLFLRCVREKEREDE